MTANQPTEWRTDTMIDAMLFALNTLDDSVDVLDCLTSVQTSFLPVPQIPSRAPVESTTSNENSRMSPTGPCALCASPILDRSFLLIGDHSWHAQCARCSTCQEPLEQHATCYWKHGALYCKRDYATKFWHRCRRCFALIEPGCFVITSRDEYFHAECFSCVTCGRVLRQGDTYAQGAEGTLVCQAHCEVFPNVQPEAENDSPGISAELITGSMDLQPRFPSLSRNGKEAKKAIDYDLQNSSLFYDSAGDGEHTPTGPNGKKRVRTSFKIHQLRTMKNYFALNHNPDAKDLKQLAQKTGLTKRVLQVWFQNARAKWRRQTNGRDGSLSPTVVSFHETTISIENPTATFATLSASPGSAAEGRSYESMSPEVSSGEEANTKVTSSD